MIVVTTPTAKIGSQVLPHLLAAKEAVRVVVRDASKLPSEVWERVEVVTGSLDDEAIMEKAFKVPRVFFWSFHHPSLTTTTRTITSGSPLRH